VSYTDAQARQQLLDALGTATDHLAVALARLGEAYERLDDQTADRLEAELFRPVQLAYGRAQRTYTEFAARHSLPTRSFAAAHEGLPHTLKELIDAAVAAISQADSELGTLQDSMLPIDVGDPELRGGLEAVRQTIGESRTRARAIVRTLGR
jgi:hypothetical protein